jgi:N-acetylglutamate synthase-like GNAT family acetyltransferase
VIAHIACTACRPTLTVQEAQAADLGRVIAFYRASGYQPEISPGDIIITAEQNGEICGALRVCEEEGKLVLRGVRVVEALRRQGIGTRLLRAAEVAIGSRDCFCIPHRYLAGFYGRVGFVEIGLEKAPAFLRERCARYRRQHNVDALVMHRAADRAET